MITTNDFNQTVFAKNTGIETILTYGLKNGADKMQQVIKNTYMKADAEQIINIINSSK